MNLALPQTETAEAALGILRTLRAGGHQAFFAGGCVRDLLLGLEPKDFDVATSATPATIAALFPETQGVGAHFGVMLVLSRAGTGERERIATEVATFRDDGSYSDGRRPDAVRFSTDPREDVLRRDFTVNGMLLDPLAGQTSGQTGPEVLDFVNGQRDLADGTIRAIGDPRRRFTEDKLRMLRAVRFAARLGFELDPGTAEAMRALAADIRQVSQERIRDELTRMLTQGNARRALELLDATGLLAEVLPEVQRMHGVEQPPEYHPEGDVWIHTLMLLDHLPAGASPTLAWGMLLHDVGKPATFQLPTKPGDRIRFNGHAEVGTRIAEDLLARLRFSNDDTAQILALVQHHMRFGDVKSMRPATLKRFLRMPRFDEHLHLHYADCMSCHQKLGMYEFAREHFERDEPEATRPRPLLTGRHLIEAGYKPSPQFKPMLLLAEDAQLEARVHTTDEALQLVQAEFGPPA